MRLQDVPTQTVAFWTHLTQTIPVQTRFNRIENCWLKTTDGALIGMTYRGVRHGPADVIARLENGEAVDPATYYFRIAPLFETASAEYAWINNVVAVGIGHRRTDGPVYSVFEVR